MNCANPFKFIEVHKSGVFPCCPGWCSHANAIVWEVRNWGGGREIWKTFAAMDVTREDNPLHDALLEQLRLLARVPADRLHLSPRLMGLMKRHVHGGARTHSKSPAGQELADSTSRALFIHTFYAPEGDAIFQAFRNAASCCFATPHDRRLLEKERSIGLPLMLRPNAGSYPVLARFQEYASFFYPDGSQIPWNIVAHEGRGKEAARAEREYLGALGKWARSKGRVPVFWLEGSEGAGSGEKFDGAHILVLSNPACAWRICRKKGDGRWQKDFVALMNQLGFRIPECMDILFERPDGSDGWRLFCEAWMLFSAFQAAIADAVLDMEAMKSASRQQLARQSMKEIAGFEPDFSRLESKTQNAGASVCPAVIGTAAGKWLGTPARENDLLARIKMSAGSLSATAAKNIFKLREFAKAASGRCGHSCPGCIGDRGVSG